MRTISIVLAALIAALALASSAIGSAPRKANDSQAWACLHYYETRGQPRPWATNTGNGQYGGLQEDLGFQRTYGAEFLRRWGTADHWPAWAQIRAARRARDGYHGYRARGYTPWPNTARLCGLL